MKDGHHSRVKVGHQDLDSLVCLARHCLTNISDHQYDDDADDDGGGDAGDDCGVGSAADDDGGSVGPAAADDGADIGGSALDDYDGVDAADTVIYLSRGLSV